MSARGALGVCAAPRGSLTGATEIEEPVLDCVLGIARFAASNYTARSSLIPPVPGRPIGSNFFLGVPPMPLSVWDLVAEYERHEPEKALAST